MKIVAIVQARMGSSRFPGKILEDLDGKPVLQHVIDFLKKLKEDKHIDEFLIAIPNTSENQILWNYLIKNKINFFKGSNEDVLDRYYQCAKKNKADCIVRMCSDVPYLKEWQIIQQIENFKKYNSFSYGNGAWVCSFAELEESWINGKHPEVREHVNDRMFNAIDYPDDLERLKRNKK
jgi:spore coat polysaccharide biosynthesis protein SpsF